MLLVSARLSDSDRYYSHRNMAKKCVFSHVQVQWNPLRDYSDKKLTPMER